MKRRVVYYSLFFILLVAGFLYALTKLVPGFGEVKLPVISHVQPFSFIDQQGRRITEKDVKGKVYVAEYFFTTCKGICPKMNRNMKKVFENFPREKDFLILSHTVDPETDSVTRLKRYGDSLGIPYGKWFLLTGRKDSLYQAARVSYILDDPNNKFTRIEDQFLHTQFFALVDREGRVRKIYDGLKKEDIEELTGDIHRLLAEKSSATPLTAAEIN